MNCVFLHHQDPFLKMGPFKYEYLNKGPNVGLVHDLISKKIIEKIKLNARQIIYIRTVKPCLLFSFGTFDSFLAGLSKNQMFGACCLTQKAHKPVYSRRQFISE